MRVTKKTVKWFENEQKTYGTQVALFNLVWLITRGLLRDMDVTNLSTETKDEPKAKKVKVEIR